MSFENVDIKRRVKTFSDSPQYAAVDRVKLWVDSNTYYRSPSAASGVTDDQFDAMTGHLLEADCPYATQSVADELLSSLSGLTYKPFEAVGARLEPAAEIGDGIQVFGKHSILASQKITFDPISPSNIGARSPEDEGEYPYIDNAIRTIIRQRNDIFARLTVLDDAITAEVTRAEGAEGGLSTSITILEGQITNKITSAQAQSLIDQTISGITLSVTASGSTQIIGMYDDDGNLIDTGSVDLSGYATSSELTILSNAVSLKITSGEAQTLIDTTVQAITLSISNSGTSSTITMKSGNVTIDSGTVTITGFVEFSDLYDGTTTISGSNITTGTINANLVSVKNAFTVKDSGGTDRGYIGCASGYNIVDSAGTTTYGVAMSTSSNTINASTNTPYVIVTTAGARMSADANNAIYVTSSGVYKKVNGVNSEIGTAVFG